MRICHSPNSELWTLVTFVRAAILQLRKSKSSQINYESKVIYKTHICKFLDCICFYICGILPQLHFDFVNARSNIARLKHVNSYERLQIYCRVIKPKEIKKETQNRSSPTSLSLLFLIPLMRSVRLLSKMRSKLERTFRRAMSSHLEENKVEQ